MAEAGILQITRHLRTELAKVEMAARLSCRTAVVPSCATISTYAKGVVVTATKPLT